MHLAYNGLKVNKSAKIIIKLLTNPLIPSQKEIISAKLGL
jgi:hypothetical protein